MRRASASETFRQRRIFSVARRFLLAGRKIQIKLAKPRPNFRQNFRGNRQIILLSNFKNLYSMSATLLCAVYSAVENFFLPSKIFSCRRKFFHAARRFFRRPKIFPPPEDFSAAVNFFDEKKSPRACEGFLCRLKFLAATIRRGRWRRCRRVITSAVAIIGRGRRCPGRIITSAVTIGRRRVVSVIVAIMMMSRRRVIAVPTLPIFAVAAFVFGLAPEQMFVPEVRPRSCLLRFDLRVQVVGGCCLRLSAEKNRACRHSD